MKRSERFAKKINDKIKDWVKNQAKLVVAIDGYAGSGKTTVANFMAKQNSDVLTVHLDDFIRHWKDRKEMIEEAKDKSQVFEYHWYRYDDLEKLIREFKAKNRGTIKFKTYDYDKNDFGPEKSLDLSKKILVIDGIFLFHPEHKISQLWDRTVYLDADFAKADRNRIHREKKKWGKDYVSEDNPDNWFKYYREAYQRYVREYKPKTNRDLIFKI